MSDAHTSLLAAADADSPDALIADGANRLLASLADKALRLEVERGHWPAEAWRQITDSGFHLLAATEAAGGAALPLASAWPLLRGLGAWQVPLPLAETLVAAQLASLAELALPAADAPLALIEQSAPGSALQVDAGGDTVSGTVHGAAWARHAHSALLSLADGRLAWLPLRDAPGVTLQPHANHAGLPSDTLQLQSARLAAIARNPLALAQPVWVLGAVARSAMLVGALESALQQSVQYAGERVQFGKPIGKYQAIQQQLALLAGDVAAARTAALVACGDAPGVDRLDAPAARFSAAVAKVRCGEAATRATSIAHQVHGAIGFTHEHALHFATRRLWAWREEFGTDGWWAAELGRAAIAARADGFWAGLTAKAL